MKQGCGQVGTCHPQSDQSCFHWAQWGWAPGPCWMGAQACSTPTLGHGVLFTKITQSSSQPHAAITHVHTHMLRAPAGHNRYPAHSLVHGKHASAPPKPTPPSPPPALGTKPPRWQVAPRERARLGRGVVAPLSPCPPLSCSSNCCCIYPN